MANQACNSELMDQYSIYHQEDQVTDSFSTDSKLQRDSRYVTPSKNDHFIWITESYEALLVEDFAGSSSYVSSLS